MIRYITVVFIYIHVSLGWSQQDPQYTQYTYAMGLLNPAYVATTEGFSVTTLGRTQWVGIEGAPQTATLTAGLPLGERIGTSLSFIRDEIGPAIESHIFADFSYNIEVSQKLNLAFGLRGGINFLDVSTLEFSDNNFDPLDVPISISAPNFGAGVFLYSDKLYFGFSVPNIIETEHIEQNGNFVSTAAEAINFFTTFGYVFNLNSKMRLKPSTMVKIGQGGNYSVDLSANLLINETFEFGLSHRADGANGFDSESLSALFAFNLAKDFRIGYAFDYSLGAFEDFNAGTHEIMISYTFRKNTKFTSPRFF